MAQEHITLATQTIHNPDEPRHFMRLKPVPRCVRVLKGETVLADTNAAMRLTEIGRDIYDRVFYIPQEDVHDGLKPIAGKSTHCPLQRDASYFSGEDGEPLAWTYDRPFDATKALEGLIAFFPEQVMVEETGREV